MTKTGTAIEKKPELLPDAATGKALPVEVVPVDGGAALNPARERDVRAQRLEVANRVLSLLGSLGNLALRFLDARDSAAGSVTKSVAGARPTVQQTVDPEPQSRRAPAAVSDPRFGAGSGGQRRRQGRRHRGAG